MMKLTETDKKELLKIAREAIEADLKGVEFNTAPSQLGGVITQEARGAFVTLHTMSGELRGCIGVFTSEAPLFKVVRDMAVSAATDDPRFSPVTIKELEDVRIEISALTPLKEITGTGEIEIGRHGIYIIRGNNRGVLLPQVATEHGFDLTTFLEETCLKAGLHKDAWKEEAAKIFIFSAEVFSE
ncbi:MAG: AmmeMemoRadiSam system protein A [Deltaproteobacteria bacterium]|nr:AmmeMemoRadiSam system protein A [Deltaproteobacteria bacterium]